MVEATLQFKVLYGWILVARHVAFALRCDKAIIFFPSCSCLAICIHVWLNTKKGASLYGRGSEPQVNEGCVQDKSYRLVTEGILVQQFIICNRGMLCCLHNSCHCCQDPDFGVKS